MEWTIKGNMTGRVAAQKFVQDAWGPDRQVDDSSIQHVSGRDPRELAMRFRLVDGEFWYVAAVDLPTDQWIIVRES